MKTADICNTRVVVAVADAPLTDVAKLMRKNHVGSVVIVDTVDALRPVGIVTDRDIVVEVIAAGQDARAMTASAACRWSMPTACWWGWSRSTTCFPRRPRRSSTSSRRSAPSALSRPRTAASSGGPRLLLEVRALAPT